jgi:hypothetical protein
MASELRVTTIANNAGTESVDTTYVINGSAKAWGHFEGSDATLDDSFNTTSLTDNSTGSFSPQLTNSLANTNYASSTNCANTSNTASNSGSKAQTYATGSFNIVTTQNGADADVNDTIYTAHGDLA